MRRQKIRIKATRRPRRAIKLERKNAKIARMHAEYSRDVRQVCQFYKIFLLFELRAEQRRQMELRLQIYRLQQL